VKALLVPVSLILAFFLAACAQSPITRQDIYFPPEDGPWERVDTDQSKLDQEALEALFAFAQETNSSGLVIVQNGRILAQRRWELDNPVMMANIGYKDVWYHGESADGWAREDVASAQKSVIAVLAGIARDRDILDFDAPVTEYLGPGWSQATAEQEAVITVRHLMSMTSGLSEKLEFVFPAGEDWAYINKAYSLVYDVIGAASGREPGELTREWLTEPLGMTQSEWITRSEFFRQWNMNGFVTTAPDLARFGLMILAGGQWDGRVIVERETLEEILSPSSPHNPAYGLLWWLNNPQGWRWVRGVKDVTPGKVIAAAPADLVAAMGTSERRCYVVPSLGLVVTRTGSTWKLDDDGNFVRSRDFDLAFWELLSTALFGEKAKPL
jgi:CubicO group peptidase (beta-lactamase class C family)